jgi:hypothetical protein
LGLDISWDVSVRKAGGSLAERRDVHQHRAAGTRHPDAVVLDSGVEITATAMLLKEGVEV